MVLIFPYWCLVAILLLCFAKKSVDLSAGLRWSEMLRLLHIVATIPRPFPLLATVTKTWCYIKARRLASCHCHCTMTCLSRKQEEGEVD